MEKRKIWFTIMGWSPMAAFNTIWAFKKKYNILPDEYFILYSPIPRIANNLNKIKDWIRYLGPYDALHQIPLENESLEEFVVNKNETEKIIEYMDEIVQKLDPVYMDPKHDFIKAHFYSPVKRIFGNDVDTYWINVIVLWFITLVFYFILYFRLVKMILDSGDAAIGRKHKSSLS